MNFEKQLDEWYVTFRPNYTDADEFDGVEYRLAEETSSIFPSAADTPNSSCLEINLDKCSPISSCVLRSLDQNQLKTEPKHSVLSLNFKEESENKPVLDSADTNFTKYVEAQRRIRELEQENQKLKEELGAVSRQKTTDSSASQQFKQEIAFLQEQVQRLMAKDKENQEKLLETSQVLENMEGVVQHTQNLLILQKKSFESELGKLMGDSQERNKPPHKTFILKQALCDRLGVLERNNQRLTDELERIPKHSHSLASKKKRQVIEEEYSKNAYKISLLKGKLAKCPGNMR